MIYRRINIYRQNSFDPEEEPYLRFISQLPVIAFIAFNFEDTYVQLSQIQKTLSLKVTRMLLEVKKKTIEKWTASTALMKLEAKQVCT